MKSAEYTTATDSESEEEPAYYKGGIQFVKPRIFESGGGKWQKVIDETDGKLSVEEKLAKLGVTNTTEAKFGKSQTLTLGRNNTQGSAGIGGKTKGTAKK